MTRRFFGCLVLAASLLALGEGLQTTAVNILQGCDSQGNRGILRLESRLQAVRPGFRLKAGLQQERAESSLECRLQAVRSFGEDVHRSGLLTPPLPGAEPGSGSPSGTIRLPSGLTAHYAYHFNRNALRDSRRAGDAIIALTDSGNLLRLDLATLKLTREWFGPVPVVCLGRGENDAILAGFRDGRVCRVDPATLALTELIRLPDKPQWVGAVTDGAPGPGNSRLVAVVERKKEVTDAETGERYELPYSIVHDLASKKSYTVDFKKTEAPSSYATAFLLDRGQRLWLGADNGEWGGWCAYVDLKAGKLQRVPGVRRGVFGFTELRDGQVWAHGGLTHLDVTSGYILRVDRGRAEPLFARHGPPEHKPGANPPPDNRPYLPISHIVEDPRTGAILVVSFSDIFQTDSRLARWTKLHELNIRYRWGRSDAVGAYPSVQSVFSIDEPGKTGGLIFATLMDGFVRLVSGKESQHAIATGQLEVDFIDRIESSSEGILVFTSGNTVNPWRFRDEAWSQVSFAPPFEKDPNEQVVMGVPSGPIWSETRMLVGRDGAIVTVNEGNIRPGTTTTARWRNGKAEVLGRESSSLNSMACFMTPDGQLWNAENNDLLRLADGRWGHAARYDWPRGATPDEWIGIGWGLRAVNDAGPPWILLDHFNELLLRLSFGPDLKAPRLSVLSLGEGDRALEVRDAIPWTKAELLLATDRGLKVFTLDRLKLAAAPINTGSRSIARLCRDGRGRLWLGGDGLAVVEAGGKSLHSLDDLPMMGRATINALVADPDHPDGVIAALDRGVVFVRVSDK